jgi:uncharacterized membrane protein
MRAERLSAFTDGVLAIVLTIIVLELPLPRSHGMAALAELWPSLGAYALSFVNIGIFWNNHHHLMHLVRKVDGRVLWANLFLLFWLSLIPFVIRWIGEAKFSAEPVAAYGVVLTGAAVAYWLLERVIILVDVAEEGEAPLEIAVGSVVRERLSMAAYMAGAVIAFFAPLVSIAVYIAVSAMWFMPDRRVEKEVEKAVDGQDDADAGP